jgi:hypothetical protein
VPAPGAPTFRRTARPHFRPGCPASGTGVSQVGPSRNRCRVRLRGRAHRRGAAPLAAEPRHVVAEPAPGGPGVPPQRGNPDNGQVTAPDSHTPPVYACAAGAVVHAHSANTLEPALLLHTFLPPGVEELLRTEAPRVDVSGDGPGAATVTVRVLAGSTSLSWSVPIGPVVAALPGQPGDDGRMVLLALVDSEPSPVLLVRPHRLRAAGSGAAAAGRRRRRGAARAADPLAGRRPRAAAARRRARPCGGPLACPDAGHGVPRPLPRRPGGGDGHHRPGARAVAGP